MEKVIDGLNSPCIVLVGTLLHHCQAVENASCQI